MSRRTSEASKAIRKAWEKEKELVAEGKGTRDWTTEQQKEILEFGKAYYHSDDPNDIHDGDAFIGHHMKSAEAYPEYQGDPENIQFLSYPEHQEAHKGNWQIPSNWYYDPVTKEYTEFGEGKFLPCKVINLTETVQIPSVEAQKSDAETNCPAQIATESVKEQTQQSPQEAVSHHSETKSQSKTTVPPPEVHESFGDKVLRAVDAVKGFSERHPILTGIVKWGGIAAAAITTAALANNSSGGGGSSGGGESDSSSSDLFDDYSGQTDDSDDYSDSSGSRDYPDERSSPREHDVSGYDRQQNGKTVHVNPYKRGGRHDD
jgi:hypothetical protein